MLRPVEFACDAIAHPQTHAPDGEHLAARGDYPAGLLLQHLTPAGAPNPQPRAGGLRLEPHENPDPPPAAGPVHHQPLEWPGGEHVRPMRLPIDVSGVGHQHVGERAPLDTGLVEPVESARTSAELEHHEVRGELDSKLEVFIGHARGSFQGPKLGRGSEPIHYTAAPSPALAAASRALEDPPRRLASDIDRAILQVAAEFQGTRRARADNARP